MYHCSTKTSFSQNNRFCEGTLYEMLGKSVFITVLEILDFNNLICYYINRSSHLLIISFCGQSFMIFLRLGRFGSD